MDPQLTLKSPLRYLKGVGPERHKVLQRLGLETVEDLFYFFPRRYEDRGPVRAIRELVPGEKGCTQGVIASSGLVRTRYGQVIFRAAVRDVGGMLQALWFNQAYLGKILVPRARVILYGRAETNGRTGVRMVHPEYEVLSPGTDPSGSIHSGRIVPIYPLTEDLSQKGLRQLVFHLLERHEALLADALPEGTRRRLELVDLRRAMRRVHFPDSESAREAAYRRLVLEEFLLLQLAVQAKRAQLRAREAAFTPRGGDREVEAFLGSLDFEPTPGQLRAVREIVADMKKGRPMGRLVQGDVGSGKTVVAAAALAFTAANGFQAALMAPTEVLAQQLYVNLTRFLEPFSMRCGYLAQGLPPAERARTLEEVASGRIQVAVGTHALIQREVRFKRLGLVVIDEQHKFGVFQRAGLKEKASGGVEPHLLLLTATPIPRTLALTLYGDLDISAITEMPKGRRPVRTFWVGEPKRAEVYRMIEGLLAAGRQGYVICPLIREGTALTAKSALAAHGELTRIFASRKVGLLHGRLNAAQKKKVMEDFREGRIELLVSTVVIEVGVDVPNATFMVIENAERFGLSQLHQLRGRVGRGAEESFCVLFSEASGDESAERLEAFESLESGFDLAEKDLELRGAGDLAGRRQHGAASLRIGDLARDAELLVAARDEAARILGADARLVAPEHAALRRALNDRFGAAGERPAASA